jgi:hypothetical protein
MTGAKHWPADAVMVVASLAGDEIREQMDGISVPRLRTKAPC